MLGSGKHRSVVLYDTLVQRLEPDEIVAIVGTEFAHARLNRCVISFCMSSAHSHVFDVVSLVPPGRPPQRNARTSRLFCLVHLVLPLCRAQRNVFPRVWLPIHSRR